METLTSLLKSLNLNNLSDVQAYIDNNYHEQSSLSLKILKKEDLLVDEEGRIFEEEINFEKVIINVDELNIRNTGKIFIQDCIFTGILSIGNNEEKDLSIGMNSVAFYKGLKILNSQNTSSISLTAINTPILKIVNNTCESLSIVSCKVSSFSLMENIIKNTDIFFNKFSKAEIWKNEFEKINFPRSQIDISKVKIHSKTKKEKKLINDFSFLDYSEIIDFDGEIAKEKNNIVNSTYKFLLQNSDYHIDNRAHYLLKYLEGESSLNSPIKLIFYRLFGGLLIPSRIIFLVFLTIILFALLYLIPVFTFSESNCIKQGLEFKEALYFSGISFTTIGYGDISPTGYTRALVVFEGLIGIILSGSYLVSLVRRYME